MALVTKSKNSPNTSRVTFQIKAPKTSLMGISLPTILTTTVKKRIVSARISRFSPKFDHWMRHFYHCRENSWKPILGAETMHFNFKSVEKSRFSKTHK